MNKPPHHYPENDAIQNTLYTMNTKSWLTRIKNTGELQPTYHVRKKLWNTLNTFNKDHYVTNDDLNHIAKTWAYNPRQYQPSNKPHSIAYTAAITKYPHNQAKYLWGHNYQRSLETIHHIAQHANKKAQPICLSCLFGEMRQLRWNAPRAYDNQPWSTHRKKTWQNDYELNMP